MKFLSTTVKEAQGQVRDLVLPSGSVDFIRSRKPDSFELSLLGRLLVAKLAKLKRDEVGDFLYKSAGSFKFKNFYWSISHKPGFVAAAIGPEPVGIDVEICLKKNKDLFKTFDDSEWGALGRKSWKNFYAGWTAKEACLKKLSLGFGEIKKIRVISRKNGYILLKYCEKTVAVRTIIKNKIILSVSP